MSISEKAIRSCKDKGRSSVVVVGEVERVFPQRRCTALELSVEGS
jgi:hypothetical protein